MFCLSRNGHHPYSAAAQWFVLATMTVFYRTSSARACEVSSPDDRHFAEQIRREINQRSTVDLDGDGNRTVCTW
jgi:hypothetical protein